MLQKGLALIAWQDAWQIVVPLLFGIGGLAAYAHKAFASKNDLKMLIDAALQRFDATKDSTRAVAENVTRVERQVAEIRSLLDRILLSRAGK